MLIGDFVKNITCFINEKDSILKAIDKLMDNWNDDFIIVDKDKNPIGTLSKERVLEAYRDKISLDMPINYIANTDYLLYKHNTPITNVLHLIDDNAIIIVEDDHNNVVGLFTKKIFVNNLLEKIAIIFDKNEYSQIYEINNADSKKLIEYYKNAVEIKKLNYKLTRAIHESSGGIYLTDNKGTTLLANKGFEEMSGVKISEVIGKNVYDLEEKKFFNPSVNGIVLKEKRRVTIIQKMRSGERAIVTGSPIFNKKGELIYSVSNSKSFEELNIYNNYLTNYKEKSNNIKSNKIGNKKIIYQSAVMDNIINTIHKISTVDSTILITGESGVGKGIIAEYIHSSSKRSKNKLVEINCGAIPESLFESELFGYESGAFTGAKKQGKPGLIEIADKGTLFLDEIGEMPFPMQVKLLKVIQNKQIVRVGGTEPIDIDVRIISATNKDLEKLISEGKFRVDLYYRLNVVPIHIPPLRERRKDIVPLLQHYLNKYNYRYHKNVELSEEVLDEIINYDWPGNVRELENFIERVVIIKQYGIITKEDLPFGILKNQPLQNEPILVKKIIPLKEAIEEVERQLIYKAFKISESSYELAEILGISQSSAHRRIKKYINNVQKNQ